MELSFHPLSLEAVDAAPAEALCLFIGADERPLTGLAGLVDWRLTARLSRLLKGGLLTGHSGEAVLTPPGARLPYQKLFLFGLGPRLQTEEELTDRVAGALARISAAGVSEVAVQIPPRLAPEAAVKLVLGSVRGPARALLFAAEPQKLAAAFGTRPTTRVAGPAAPAPAQPRTPPRSPPPLVPPKAAPPAFAPAPDRAAQEPAPALAPEPPVAQPLGSDPPRKPAPQSQRYVPPPPRDDHVFKKKR